MSINIAVVLAPNGNVRNEIQELYNRSSASRVSATAQADSATSGEKISESL